MCCERFGGDLWTVTPLCCCVHCGRWCTDQLVVITGSDDLTLAKFCMTLDSAVEVTEYFVQYLVRVEITSQ